MVASWQYPRRKRQPVLNEQLRTVAAEEERDMLAVMVQDASATIERANANYAACHALASVYADHPDYRAEWKH